MSSRAAAAFLLSTCAFAQAHFEVASVRPSNLTGEGSRRENDISAKAAKPTDEKQMRPMLQALLAERFKLTLHHQEKEMTVYALVVAKSGLKMTPGNADGKSVFQGNALKLIAKDTSIGEIVDNLSRAGKGFPGMDIPPVVDMTGLTGRYNFTLDASEVMQAFSAEAQKTVPDPAVLIGGVQDVMEHQLGLHADLRKAKADLLVIDHAEQTPTGN